MKDSQGRPVILLHLKRFWEGQVGSWYIKDLDLYEEIKAGRKTSEFREETEYWEKRLLNAAGKRAWFVVGYPKGNLPRLEANIAEVILDLEVEQIELKFRDVVEKKSTVSDEEVDAQFEADQEAIEDRLRGEAEAQAEAEAREREERAREEEELQWNYPTGPEGEPEA